MRSRRLSRLTSSFNSRLREEATVFSFSGMIGLIVSTHASVRRRQLVINQCFCLSGFQLTPP